MNQQETLLLDHIADNADKSDRPDESKRHSHYLAYALITLVLLVTGAVRFHLRNIPLERDEGEYAYAGQLILQGVPPYQLAYNMKLPGTYAAYALIMAVFGQTTPGIHLGVLVVNLATILLVAVLAWRFTGPVGAVAAAASYGLLSTSSSVLGFCGHATHFVVLPAIAGILLLLEGVEKRRKSLFFFSGMLLGLGVLMKQPGFLFVMFGAFYFLRIQGRKGLNWRTLGETLGLYSLGAALPFLVTCLILWHAGVFGTFWFWTVSYASQYASNYGLTAGVYFFYNTISGILNSSVWLWIIAFLGLIVVCCDRKSPPQRTQFLLGFFLFSFLAVCPTMAFRPHYFILMLPAVSVLVGVAVSAATSGLDALPGRRNLRYAPGVLFALALAACFYQQRNFLLETDPIAACRSVYYSDPFPEAVTIADYIHQHTPENARIAVLGSEPEIYFYSHRHSATGYIYTYGLVENQKYALRMQEQMISEIEAARPEILVFVNLYGSWAPHPDYQNLIYIWARKYIQDHYDLTGIVDIPMAKGNYRWGDDAKSFKPRANSAVFVFKRITQ